MRSAPPFQLVMMPSRSLPTIASSLDSMIAASRSAAASLRLLRYILEAVDGADNVSRAILDCLDVNERGATRAVRSLNVDFLSAHGNASAQHIGHGALMVREQTAVGAEHSIRSAKSFIGIANRGRPAPEFGSAAVVSKNQPVPVTNINGKRQLFEKLRGQFEGLSLRTQTKDNTRCIWDRVNLDGARGFAPEGRSPV